MIDGAYLKVFENDPELKQLEYAQSRFNIFDAIGATHKELWHSDFLAFLLNPSQSHGLGDEFLKRLLRCAIPELAEFPSWSEVSVRREHKYIDILVEDAQKQISVIIENKIWSPEAPGQLATYWQVVLAEHPAHWQQYGIFLTPDGRRPLKDEDREHYRAVSYTQVKSILESLPGTSSKHIDVDVTTTIRHYVDTLGRFIVGNADAEAFARKLYFKHKSAIRLMDPANWKGWIRAHLDHLILDSGQLQPESSTTEYIRFTMRAWASARGFRSSAGATSSYPHFYFTLYNFEDSLTLSLWVGPSVAPETKTRLLDMGEQKIPPFCKPGKEGQYYYIYRLALLTRKDYEERSDDDLKALIAGNWQQFLEEDLPEISRALEATSWFQSADELTM